MTIKLHYGVLSPTTFTGTPASGYPASSVGASAIAKPYVSTAAATSTDSFFNDLGSSKTVAAVGVQSFPQSGTQIYAGASALGTLRGTVTTAVDRHGVSKLSISFTPASCRYVDLNTASQTSIKGSGVYSVEKTNKHEIGAIYIFGGTLEFGQALIGSQVEYEYPDHTEKLPNGQAVTHSRGAPKAIIKLDFLASGADDVEKMARIAREGICWLDMGITDRRELQWPVRFIEAKHSRNLFPQAVEKLTLIFEEVT